MYVKAFIVKVNKCPKPFFLEQHINTVNTVTLQSYLRLVPNDKKNSDTIDTLCSSQQLVKRPERSITSSFVSILHHKSTEWKIYGNFQTPYIKSVKIPIRFPFPKGGTVYEVSNPWIGDKQYPS